MPGTVCYHPLVKLPGQRRRPSEPAQNISSAESASQYFQRRPGFQIRPTILSLFLSLCPAFAFAQSQQASGNVIRFVRNPDVAPDFKLDDLDGKPLSLAAAHGKVVLLNFWATWCGPCREEIPDLIELQTKYKDRLQIIGISVDDDEAGVVKKVVDDLELERNGVDNSPVSR